MLNTVSFSNSLVNQQTEWALHQMTVPTIPIEGDAFLKQINFMSDSSEVKENRRETVLICSDLTKLI
ncbi:hypothetical protein AT251_01810 [Enterovibrio nigricans]|nr:hypothetical protein AT251_01810 [Enterovibrio nigricans]